MISFIQDWVKNILIYLIIITIIQSLLPQGQYVKYIKVFTGLILMIIVLMPVVSISGLDKQINYSLLGERYQLDQGLMKKQYKELSKQQEELILSAYRTELENQIKFLLNQEDIFVSQVSVTLESDFESNNFGNIKSIDLVASFKEVRNSSTVKIDRIIITHDNSTIVKTPEEIIFEKRIKSILIDFYKLPSDNININMKV
ncbi:stage III sporulation protein AF [Natranaerovirga pectinivora]|uniref:Stage III sporulation protein AF n=1 Tax=Natranaerovirga pectinivora TaxID=682400 RepID=A0A4R3MUF0_9FIRM|nr:stage III sporulation protein AF [Natranaerovirga pectinivora]TCT16916.1 stage III sporulation protein AF [Natranaerovirga pectinivora]